MSKIEDLKEELQYCQDQYDIVKNNLELCKKHLEDAKMEFRIEEVERVLEGMRTLISLGEVNEKKFDTYIVHCLNCLHGNIDGVILSIDKDIEKVMKEELDKRVENEQTN